MTAREKFEENRKSSVWSSPFFWAGVMSILLVTLLRPFMVRTPPPPPVTGHIPSYELVNQEGKKFGSNDLTGQVYVASFVFTNCGSTCPMITRAMADLQKRYDEAKVPVKLVSFTVDPENDTPEKLKEYAKKYDANFSRWSFLTGPREGIRQVLEDGFRVPLGDKVTTAGNLFDIAHTQKIVIVDQRGGIRGYYESTELGMDEVFHRSQHVLGEKLATN